MSLSRVYKKSLSNRWCVHFKTTHPEGDAYNGIVVHNGKRVVALCEVYSFEIDGIQVLPKKSFRGYRDGSVEQARNKIIRQNGHAERAKAPTWLLGCDTVRDCLFEMKGRHIWPGIEGISTGKYEMYIGQLLHIGSQSFQIRAYDATGRWYTPYEFEYSDVFRVEINSKYCRYFNRYMRSS